MHRTPTIAIATLFAVLTAAGVDARATRRDAHPARAPSSEGRRAARASTRGGRTMSAIECERGRGGRAYGSVESCRRALCSGENVTNAYVLDGNHRLRRNPCVGINPFERD